MGGSDGGKGLGFLLLITVGLLFGLGLVGIGALFAFWPEEDAAPVATPSPAAPAPPAPAPAPPAPAAPAPAAPSPGPVPAAPGPAGDPRVRTGNANVAGQLSREVIRRVIRRHAAEARHCFETGLQRDPSLGGRVQARFVIGSDGAVTSAEVGDSTLEDAEVEGCLLDAIRRWRFPSPEGGGSVTVNYPFVFSTG